MTVLAFSTVSSSSVGRVSTASEDPSAKVTETGGVLSSTLPVSETATSTVSAAAVSPVRVSANDAVAPSVTASDGPDTDTVGSTTGPGTVSSRPPANFRPPAAQAACFAAQSLVARADSVTAPSPSGDTWMPHSRCLPRSRRQALSMLPPSRSNSSSRTVRWL